MDTNWLEDFVCFARNLNFTRAAAERNVTQSAFSRRIKSLELWLGAELVDRKTFPATLSFAGEEFLPVAKHLLQTMHRNRDEIRAKVGTGLDTLSFAAPHSISIHNLMPILSQLETTIPNLKTSVTSDNLYNCCDHLTEQNCDFLMCYRFPGVPIILDEQQYHYVEIGTDRLLPVYSPILKLDKNWQLPGLDQSPVPYLHYSNGSYLASVLEQLLSTKKPNLSIRHTDAFSEALKSLCLQGAGMAFLPEASIRNELAKGELIIAGNEEWWMDLKLAIYTEPSRHTKRSETAWQYFSQLR